MKKKQPTWGKKLTAKERFVLSRTKTAATMYGPAHKIGTQRMWALHKELRGDTSGPMVTYDEYRQWVDENGPITQFDEQIKQASIEPLPTVIEVFSQEYVKIAASLIKHPKDTLDRRTTRFHRKPNPRVLPAAMPSGKLVS